MSASDYLAVCRAVESVALSVIIYVFYRGRRVPSATDFKDVARSDGAPLKNPKPTIAPLYKGAVEALERGDISGFTAAITASPFSDSDLDRQCEEAWLASLQADEESHRAWNKYIALQDRKNDRNIRQGKK